MDNSTPAYGSARQRGSDVSFEEIDRAARTLMAEGERPTVQSVRQKLSRGSPNHITDCMRRFWKNQAALNTGDPIALTRIPPELADAAVAQWERALRLSQQVASNDDNAARAHLQALRRDTEQRARSIELREKEWDVAARVRERALADSREHVNVLLKELATDRAELRLRDHLITEMEAQLEQLRQQLATVIARAVAPKHRSHPRHTVSTTVARRQTVPSTRRRATKQSGARLKQPGKRPLKSKRAAANSVSKRYKSRSRARR